MNVWRGVCRAGAHVNRGGRTNPCGSVKARGALSEKVAPLSDSNRQQNKLLLFTGAANRSDPSRSHRSESSGTTNSGKWGGGDSSASILRAPQREG